MAAVAVEISVAQMLKLHLSYVKVSCCGCRGRREHSSALL